MDHTSCPSLTEEKPCKILESGKIWNIFEGTLSMCISTNICVLVLITHLWLAMCF
jgi:hypothetical protein